MSYTCGGSGHPLGSPRCIPEDHYEGCGRQFGSLDSFDWHFRPLAHGEEDMLKRCATDKELLRHGLHLDDNQVWKRPMEEARARQLGVARTMRQAEVEQLLLAGR